MIDNLSRHIKQNESIIKELAETQTTLLIQLEAQQSLSSSLNLQKIRQIEAQKLILKTLSYKNSSIELQKVNNKLARQIKSLYWMGHGKKQQRILIWQKLISKYCQFPLAFAPQQTRVPNPMAINPDYMSMAILYYRANRNQKLNQNCQQDQNLELVVGSFLFCRPDISYFKGLQQIFKGMIQLYGSQGAVINMVWLSLSEFYSGFLQFNEERMDFYYKWFQECLSKFSKTLAQRLKAMMVPVSIYLLKFILYFFNFIDPELVKLILKEPVYYSFKTALSILSFFKSEIKARNFQEIVQMLLNWQKYLEAEQLNRILQDVDFNRDKLQQIKEDL